MICRGFQLGLGIFIVAWGVSSGHATPTSTDSAAGLLETVQPTVDPTIASPEAQSLVISFSEAVDADALSVSSYTVTGPGVGTVTTNPDAVTNLGGDSYHLIWSSGSMLFGQGITVTVSPDVQDLWGNPIDEANDEAFGTAVPVELSVFMAE